MRFLQNSLSRRAMVGSGVLSAATIGLLAGEHALAGSKMVATDTAGDVAILNVALALEHEAIAAYQIGAESGLLTADVTAVAVSFQSHHKEHRDALMGTIETLGGQPADPKRRRAYERALNVASLKSQTDVLELAARLELGAANAYLGVIPSFGNRDLAQVSARLAADETMHWTALAQALGKSLPGKALMFGG